MSESDYQRQEQMKQRARRGLTYGGRPSLRAQRNFYREQADNKDLSARDRRLWRQLADELDKRLNEAAPKQDELPIG